MFVLPVMGRGDVSSDQAPWVKDSETAFKHNWTVHAPFDTLIYGCHDANI